MTQKILAAHAGLDRVAAGQLIEAKLDVVMANDITGPMAVPVFRQMADKVFDKDKVVLVPDHFTPNKDIKSAENSKSIREFAKEQGLTHYYEIGQMGIEHALLPEKGITVAGECIIGADSHRCWNNGYRDRNGDRRALVQGAIRNSVRTEGKTWKIC